MFAKTDTITVNEILRLYYLADWLEKGAIVRYVELHREVVLN